MTTKKKGNSQVAPTPAKRKRKPRYHLGQKIFVANIGTCRIVELVHPIEKQGNFIVTDCGGQNYWIHPTEILPLPTPEQSGGANIFT